MLWGWILGVGKGVASGGRARWGVELGARGGRWGFIAIEGGYWG